MMAGMLNVQPLETLDLPELEPYRTMRRNVGHRQRRIFVAEGEKVVSRLLRSSFEVVSLLFPEKWLEHFKPLILARPKHDFPIYLAEKGLLMHLTGISMYQGVLAVGRIPEPNSTADILSRATRPWLIVAAEDLSNAENVGSVVRNATGFGAHLFIAGEKCSSPFLRRSVRSSMGTAMDLPIVETDNLAHELMRLQQAGVKCVATTPAATHTPLTRADLRGDCCLLLGSEGHGLTENLINLCDESVALPMAYGLDSLNVTNAAAVFLYEAARQQGRI